MNGEEGRCNDGNAMQKHPEIYERIEETAKRLVVVKENIDKLYSISGRIKDFEPEEQDEKESPLKERVNMDNLYGKINALSEYSKLVDRLCSKVTSRYNEII